MSKEIQVFVSALPHTPGWVALTEKDKDWLQEHTSNAVDNFRQSGMKAISACAEIAMIENFLQDKPLKITNWMETAFASSSRTAWRMLKDYKEMRGSASDEAILYLAKSGVPGLNSVYRGRIIPVLKRLPPPKTMDKKPLDIWVNKVGEEIRSDLRTSRKKKRKLSEEDAIKLGVLSLARILKDATASTSAEYRAMLKKIVGYTMMKRAITGTVSTEQIPIPDGFLPVRGRPRKILLAIFALGGSIGLGWWTLQLVEAAAMASN